SHADTDQLVVEFLVASVGFPQIMWNTNKIDLVELPFQPIPQLVVPLGLVVDIDRELQVVGPISDRAEKRVPLTPSVDVLQDREGEMVSALTDQHLAKPTDH